MPKVSKRRPKEFKVDNYLPRNSKSADQKSAEEAKLKVLVSSKRTTDVLTGKKTSKLRFKGAKLFRWRIVNSVLSAKAIRIDNIRENVPDGQAKGLTKDEVSFLKLIEAISHGTTIRINSAGRFL
jgi:hypothetical protein